MKYVKFIFILFFALIITSNQNYAEINEKTSTWGTNSDVFNKGFEDQKPVTDTALNKTIKMIKERSLSQKQKKMQREVKPLSPSSDFEHLKEFSQSQTPDDDLSQTLTVMIPVVAYNEEGVTIPPGFYKLSCRKVGKDKYMLDLSQGTVCKLSVEAIQTKQDLAQDTITFCNAEIIENGRIRLMYGSIDLNLVGYIYFK